MPVFDKKSILDKILEHKRQEVAAAQRELPLNELKSRLRDLPQSRGKSRFARALTKTDKVSLIAEIKKASPSAGLIREDFDPRALGAAYAEGGASALSVLTDRKYFQGADEYLVQAKAASGLPALRKDFTVSAYQLYDSCLLGADCVLLIAAALEEGRLAEFIALADELSLDALVEVHNQAELELAVACKARIIGVNNRDLKTFEVLLKVSENLAELLPSSCVKVSESGISSHGHIRLLGSLGYDAVLVGGHLMRAADPAAAVRTLMNGNSL
ncbi:MAG TPA: indole-3-glycerol phosphate synthase TrpC [archaeon]|nr:indole-3-glycerol phosphate synthase TrpC [archaeon]